LISLRDQLTKDDSITVATIERNASILVLARRLVERFHQMVRDRDPDALPCWIPGGCLFTSHCGVTADTHRAQWHRQ
jgi:hypothetical protein